MIRKQINAILVAANGHGKTTLQLKIANQYLRENPLKRVLWLLVDDGESKLDHVAEIDLSQILSFEGMAKIIIQDLKELNDMADIFSQKDCRFNGLVCCDDLSSILKRRPEPALRLKRRRRQSNIDFLWAFHGWRAEVPPSFWTYATHLYIFKTTDNHNITKDNLNDENQQKFEAVYQRVQQRANVNKYYFEELILIPII